MVDEDLTKSDSRARFYGKYRGIVSDNADPRSLGRLRAKVPEVLGDVETGWALPCLPYVGDGAGFYCVPARDAAVWIEFEAGHVSRPIWVGGWWGKGQLPANVGGGTTQPSLKVLRSEQGLLLALDDEGKTISLSDAQGKNLLTIAIDSGELTLRASSKVVVTAPQIELVDGAQHPAVFGDDLVQYLNQIAQIYQGHMHPGQATGPGGGPVTPTPPQPAFPQATSALLSSKVKVG